MKKGEEDGLSPELKALWPGLVDYALECLRCHCRAEKPRLHATAKAYVKRAIKVIPEEPSGNHSTLKDRLETRICALVDADEDKTWKLIAATDWTKVTVAAIASVVKLYGKQQILDKEMKDWVQEAITQLVERGRHFPHDRKKPVKVVAWIYNTVRSNISHARRDAERLPPHLHIVTTRKSIESRGEWNEERIAAAAKDDPPDEEDDDDADYARLRPAITPAIFPTGVLPNVRSFPSAAR